MEEWLKDLQAKPETVQELIEKSEAYLGTEEQLWQLVSEGKVKVLMVNGEDEESVKQKANDRVEVVANHKVPKGLCALYENTSSVAGFYRLAAA